MSDNENRISVTARIGRDDRLGGRRHALPHEQVGFGYLHDVRVAFGQIRMPFQSQRLNDIHELPVMTRVEFSILWLVGLVYYFVTSPAGMTPLPVAAGWIILGTTIVSLIVLGKRFPMFGLFLLMLITSLMRGGRRRHW